ncbi:MAG: primosomal protein N' [Nitrospirota bacterium]|nr:primosomal protein N' [Nitrospirota bacterium]
MQCFDVLFPINLGPLTYICPESLIEKVQPGMIIQAPLRNKLTKGIVIDKNTSPPAAPLKELQVCPGEPAIISKSLLKLIRWMAGYYIVSEGLVLKQALPGELFTKTQARKGKREVSYDTNIDFPDIAKEDSLEIIAAINANAYRGFLLHAPSLLYEYSIALTLMRASRNVIVLLPDIAQADLLFSAAKDLCGERVSVLHGEISRGKRSEYIEGILSGRYDIVIGTRPALFAPLKKVSLIMVLNEHSQSYKIEEGVRYNIRDVAVMRGFTEKAAVLLSSISPSIDSYFNAITNKYRLLKHSTALRRPVIRIADMRFETKIKPGFSKAVYNAAQKHIKKNHKVMFVINRKGYSNALLCHECGHIEKCSKCDIPMVLYKSDNVMKCHYCSKNQPVPEKCSRCKSHNFDLLGSGTQRVQEHIEELFRIATMRFDSDNVKKKSEKKELSRLISGDFSRVIIGTKMITRQLTGTDHYALAAVLNADSSLNLPDFRAMEKTYQELSSIIDLVEPGGDVLIQTRFPESPLFRYLRSNDYASFAKEDLLLRKSLNYPPYAKLIKISFSGPPEAAEKIKDIIHISDPNIEMLGPAVSKNRRGLEELSIILKSVDRKTLNTAAQKIKKTFEHSKKVQIRIDVDPA